jgi:hypothetical protein
MGKVTCNNKESVNAILNLSNWCALGLDRMEAMRAECPVAPEAFIRRCKAILACINICRSRYLERILVQTLVIF